MPLDAPLRRCERVERRARLRERLPPTPRADRRPDDAAADVQPGLRAAAEQRADQHGEIGAAAHVEVAERASICCALSRPRTVGTIWNSVV
jgi:hypothetical protein